MILYTFDDGGVHYKPEPYPQYVSDEIGKRFVAEGKAKSLEPVAEKKRAKREH